MSEQLEKGYDPAAVEAKWYKIWEEAGYFRADENDKTRPAYCLVYPPTNVTGTLHMGHALTVAIQDMIMRWRRMAGDNVLWLPGTDHAGIATQMVVERDLKIKEGKTRHELGREEFLKRVWKWKSEKGDRIYEQLKVLGASLDWTRSRFTMDESCSRAVLEAFVRLYRERLIYRADRLINWCPRCHTALSDLEVEHQEGVAGELWSFAYPLADGSGEIVVATTRPETMLGDSAVAVHPEDPRYLNQIGRNVRHPLLNYEFPIIADAELVDPEFGTGAVKVTPAHDPNDFETGLRHNLKFINILNPDATLNENAGRFAGLDRFAARQAVKEAIAELGLDRGRQDYQMNIGACQRCNTIVEPYISKQWFVKAEPLARPAIEAVESGKTALVPKSWDKTYFEWMRNIRDWCISRQLWWGHRIPAWYCDDCGHVTVARDGATTCEKCGGAAIHQDEDVLDTWFSSALWPFSTLGWPEETKDLQRFYPNTIMETGFDIIFFWVARMMMMGIHFLKQPPFSTVYLHAMVRDHEGRKMSKSLGNVIDPLDIIYGIGREELLAKRKSDAQSLGIQPKQVEAILKATQKLFPDGIPASGADALRFFLISMVGQGRDIKLDARRIEGYRFFANKIWNASRFAMMNLDGYDLSCSPAPEDYSLADRWILSRLRKAAIAVNEGMSEWRFDQAAMGVYHFFWNEFCDWYIELAKSALYKSENPKAKAAAQHVLARVLDAALRLLHPFMPFVTEEIWRKLPRAAGGAASIMIAPYPAPGEFADAAAYESDELPMTRLQDVIRAARNIRGECGIEPGRKIPIVVQAPDAALRALFEAQRPAIVELARLSELSIVETFHKTGPAAKGVVTGAEVFVLLAGLIDIEEEKKRAAQQLAKTTKELAVSESRLASEGFVARAPADVVATERERVRDLSEKKEKLSRHLAELEG
ncbi:MAG: valine--tRNA ligase [Myxococcales bacterium]|nr:MAG: valine--tRNA ligase [Myxococcales bacterium]